MSKCVKANVLIISQDGKDVTNEDFVGKFIRFVEENNWYVYGGYEEKEA